MHTLSQSFLKINLVCSSSKLHGQILLILGWIIIIVIIIIRNLYSAYNAVRRLQRRWKAAYRMTHWARGFAGLTSAGWRPWNQRSAPPMRQNGSAITLLLYYCIYSPQWQTSRHNALLNEMWKFTLENIKNHMPPLFLAFHQRTHRHQTCSRLRETLHNNATFEMWRCHSSATAVASSRDKNLTANGGHFYYSQ